MNSYFHYLLWILKVMKKENTFKSILRNILLRLVSKKFKILKILNFRKQSNDMYYSQCMLKIITNFIPKVHFSVFDALLRFKKYSILKILIS